MATKTPVAGITRSAPVRTSRSRTPVTPRRVALAQHLVERVVPDRLDLGVPEQPVLQDLLGAQLVAAVDQRDLGGEVGQEQRLLDRRVAAADHHDLLAAVEEAVAGGAGRDAEALELLLATAGPSHFACAPVARITASAV